MKYATLRTRKARGSVPYEEIVSSCTSNQIAYVFNKEQVSDESFDYVAYKETGEEDEFATIPFFPTIASKDGAFTTIPKPPLHIKLRRHYVEETLNTKEENLLATHIKGDSMQPKLNPNDLIILDRSRCGIQEGYLYAVRINQDIYIKQLSPRPNNRLMLLSLNRNYPPFEVSTDSPDFEIIGTAVTLSRTLI